MKMTMTATGDSLMIQGYPDGGYPGFSEVRDYIEKGQAKFNNLETNLIDKPTFGSTYCGGTWLKSESRIIDKITGFGFNFLGYANNHTMDYSYNGLLETISHLKERNIAYAGAGEDLYAAAAPVYRDLPGGRVAFISICASFEDAARAGYASRTTPGRPGLNPLRHTKELHVTKEHFKALSEICESTHFMGEKEISIKNGFSVPFKEGELNFGGVSIRLSEDGVEKKVTKCNKNDLKRTLDSIEDAKLMADYIVIMLHSHQIKGNVMNIPDDFAVEFCHTVIDAGADLVIGGDTHELKPIEIYKGKPIFYSLGNFCFQSNVVPTMPADFIEKYKMPDITDPQALALRCKGWTIGLHAQPQNFRSIIPYMEYEDGKLVSCELKPIELGYDKIRTFKGIPYPADEKVSREIFKLLKDLSKDYGTKMTQGKDGIIKIKL